MARGESFAPRLFFREATLLRFLLAVLALAAVVGCARSHVPTTGTKPVEKGKIVIRFQYTEADMKNPPVSFDVLRSSHAAGDFQAINATPIAAVEKPAIGVVQDLLTDENLPLGATYYYYIARTDSQGRRAKATSVAAAKVVIPMVASSLSGAKEARRPTSMTVARKKKAEGGKSTSGR
ncbi:hypothetical protein IT570_02175 [Candidatus Sumerlaeota bacterium]|nr:hypothetical protein [Candidatus Sumerlaeota bacterium]